MDFNEGDVDLIYFIQSEKDGPIKIGYTKAQSVEHRISELQTAHPYKLICLATCDGSMFIERLLHQKFEQYQLLGEWFEPCEELLELIKNIDKFDPRTLQAKPKKVKVPLDLDALVDELYAAALDNNLDFETVLEMFKKTLYKHNYNIMQTVSQTNWFESNHRKKFEEKRAVIGLQLGTF